MSTKISSIRKEQQITSVRLVSNSNIAGTYYNGSANDGVGSKLTLSGSTLTIDSIAAANGDRVLLINQTSNLQNGIYDVTGIDGTVILKRATDFHSFDQMVPGYYIPVSAGTAFAGDIFTIVEPQVQAVGTNAILFTNTGGAPSSVTLANNGLNVLDTNASHSLGILPGSDLTANRTLTVTTGDANRILDISAASVTVSAFGATLVDDASKLVALTTLGVKRGTTLTGAGPGPIAYAATGLVATDIVVATILSSTNVVGVAKAVPTADTLTITFTADPGASAIVQWLAIATV